MLVFGEFLSFDLDGAEPSTSGGLGGKLIPAKASVTFGHRSVRETSGLFCLCFFFCFGSWFRASFSRSSMTD